jgi:predicted nucleotidyltransferase
MKKVGIICEYNPFHNGHLYHINKIKELYPDCLIVAVMSGNFTQHGEVSIMNKWDKTECALYHGVDLVIELPFVFATQSADVFAKASIEILSALHVDTIVFGSETNNIKVLDELAHVQLENKKYQNLVSDFMDEGINYPTALSKALHDITGKQINKPNDILGITYIREIMKQKSSIIPITIKRNDNYNCKELEEFYSSATSIRYALQNNSDIKGQVPEYTERFLKQKLYFIDDYFNLLKYNILMHSDTLKDIQTVDEGIENRILKYIIESRNLNELILKIKTKRYTYNKLNRMFTHILTNFTKEEAKKFKNIEYIRVLGFNNKGRLLLKEKKENISIPIITKFSSCKSEMLDIELRSTCCYASILEEKDKIKLIESEYKNYPLQR